MFNSIDKIFVLGLLKHKKAIEEKFNNLFVSNDDKKKLVYHYTEGVGNQTSNDGSYNANLKQILGHNTTDAISKDIFMNHIKIIEKAYLGKHQNIMVLEDDAVWDVKKALPIVTKMNNFILTQPKSFDILYLGYCNYPFMFSAFNLKNPSIVRPFRPLCAHGYIVNREGLAKILYYQKLVYPTFDGHIDKFYATCSHLTKKAVFPQFIFQEKAPALYTKACDIIGVNVSFDTICKINENLSLVMCLLFYGLLFLVVFKLLRYATTGSKRLTNELIDSLKK
jgi:hypothetical protein